MQKGDVEPSAKDRGTRGPLGTKLMEATNISLELQLRFHLYRKKQKNPSQELPRPFPLLAKPAASGRPLQECPLETGRKACLGEQNLCHIKDTSLLNSCLCLSLSRRVSASIKLNILAVLQVLRYAGILVITPNSSSHSNPLLI